MADKEEVNNQNPKGAEGEPKLTQNETFEEWLNKQDEKTKAILDGHAKGLKDALVAEREAKKEMSKQLQELAKKAEKGSEVEKQLTETANALQASEKRASFYEEAIQPVIGCINPKAAYALAISENLFKGDKPLWDEIKKLAPELFAKASTTDGGRGGEKSPKGENNINAQIRRMAGRI